MKNGQRKLKLHTTTDKAVAYASAELVIIATPTNYDDQNHFFDTSAVEDAIETTTYVVKSDIQKDYKVALVSDLHNASPDPVLANLRQHQPDLIIVAGDIVYGTQLDKQGYLFDAQNSMLDEFPNAAAFIERVNGIAQTFFSYGNHEWLLTQVVFIRGLSAR